MNADSYDIIMNTHGDLLPFYEKHNDNDSAIKGKKSKINLTYCHYPLLPYQIRNGMYRTFLEKYMNDISHLRVARLFANASLQYNLMMNTNTILTNSAFSTKAIKQLYHNVDPIVLSPPVDIDKFRKAKLPYRSPYDKKQNIVLVVSRFSADKEIENAITLANLLKDKCLRGKIQETKMIIAGNFSELNYKYVQFLEKMILDYGLKNYAKLVFGASFDRLLYLMKKSKLYFHPLAGEPFGISIAEAMASGLIPIVPAVGGSTEFVPSEYQYHSIREAADIISNVLNKINDDKYINTVERSLEISNRVSIFSIQSYKRNLKNIIDYVSKTSKIEEAVILNKTQTRIPETKEV
ncbi:MAG: glycosyltransferase [Candidatus Nitrosopolaris sp.]